MRVILGQGPARELRPFVATTQWRAPNSPPPTHTRPRCTGLLNYLAITHDLNGKVPATAHILRVGRNHIPERNP